MKCPRRCGWLLALALLAPLPAAAQAPVHQHPLGDDPEATLAALESVVPMPGADTAKLLGLNINLPNIATINVQIQGNKVLAQLLILGIGAELSLTFDQPKNLSLAALGIGLQLVNPLDPAFRARLPANASDLAVALPLVIRVEPPANKGLEFRNAVEVELHTHLLPFSVASPLRLYKSPQGGPFHDITGDIQSGSVRVRGHTGGFSDFLIVIDLNPIAEAAEDKYAYLDARVLDVSNATLRSQLQLDLLTSRTAFDLGDYPAARVAIDDFATRVQANAGTLIPNRWRAQRDLDNVAGELLSEAGSLRFTLGRGGF